MRILFLGQNPSRKAVANGFTNPFEGSASGERLRAWIQEAGIPLEVCDFANVVDTTTHENKRPKFDKLSEFTLEQKLKHYGAVVAVGSFAKDALKSIRLYTKPDVAYLQHPSGLNRNLNSKAQIREQVRVIKDLYEVARARQK